MSGHRGGNNRFHLDSTVKSCPCGSGKLSPSWRSELTGERDRCQRKIIIGPRGLTTKWIALLNFVTFLDSDLDNNARHGSANRPRVTCRFLPRDSFHGRVLVFNGYSPDLQLTAVSNAHWRGKVEGRVYTSPFTSNQTSRWALPSTTGPTAIRRTMSVFPFSIEMCISSPVSGRPKKNLVGTTLTISF